MSDKNLTDNEIIKAIERCMIPIGRGGCQGCPMYNEEKCLKKLFKMIVDLINRLQAENERLEKEVETFSDIGKMYSEVKAEAYKECIERVKDIDQCTFDGWIEFPEDKLDNLLKGLVG